MQQADITIIGGGVSGITTALTLRLLGFNTICYAEHLVNEQAPSDSRFASLYPAASVIPHSVRTNRMDELFPSSQQIFNLLLQHHAPFMQLHRHYEVHEFPVEDPLYAGFLKEYRRIENTKDPFVPRYSDNIDLYGWSFNCLVAEWPGYMDQLYRWYREAGGTIIQKKITEEDIGKMSSDIIVNCSGIWSTELFGEPEIPAVQRGHLFFVKGAPLITCSDDTIVSYNYTPDTEIYSDPQGNPCDVYFYPRNNGWVLGGSRQMGTIDARNNFEGKEHTDPIIHCEVSLPRPILELNKKILDRTFNKSLNGQWTIEPKVGYRFIGSSDKPGLRLDSTEYRGKKIIHNYGHGGAGVTLSWGCALEVERMVRHTTGQNISQKPGGFRSAVLNYLQKALSDIAWK